jgi:hypothetical protein
MKHSFATAILTTAILASVTFVAQAEDRSIPEKVRDTAGNVSDKTREVARDTKDAIVGAAHRAGRATRAAWGKTKAYFSDDMPVYREGASATLAGLSREIAELKARTPSAAPAYFRTRLLALDEQHAHLAMRLAQLSHQELKARSTGPRYDFDQCLGDLEQAIDQAEAGVGVLSNIALK